MSPTAATMGTTKRSKKRKPTTTPPESEEPVYDATATMESRQETHEPEQQDVAGDDEPVEAGDQDEEQEQGNGVSYRAVELSFV
jgi:hypothetical protein